MDSTFYTYSISLHILKYLLLTSSTLIKLLQRKSARPSFNDKSYLRKVIVDTICCHGILTESLEVDGGPIKGVVVGIPEHQTGPRP